MKEKITKIVLIGFLFSITAVYGYNGKEMKSATTPTTTAAGDKTKSFDGWVGDEKCGASKIDAACSKMCHSAGAKLVFVGTDKSVTPVANQQVLESFIGQHVNLQGKLENGVLTVVSVKVANK